MNTVKKHTSGPWRIRNGMVGDSVLAGSIRICLVDRIGPMEANARLIAAAPELYEAARKLVNNLPDVVLDEMRMQWGNSHTEVVEMARDNLRAAIAKAEDADA